MNNPVQALQTLVDTAEKLYILPKDELLQNGKLVQEMHAAMNAHNIDGILNGIQQGLRDAQETQRPLVAHTDALLHVYAQRENERVKKASENSQPYITEIINAKDSAKFTQILPDKAGRTTEKKFSSAFNSVYADGALKINTPADPSLLFSYIDYSPYRVNYSEYLSVPTLSELVDRPLQMALKKFPKIKCKNDKIGPELEKIFREVKIKNVIKDALFYSLLSPRGSLVVPIKRGDKVTFNVFNDTQFAYGMGASYSGVTQPYSTTKVGDLYCMGTKLRHGVSAFFTCPGYEPLFGVGKNRVPQLRSAAEAWNLYVHVLKILLVRAQVIIEKMEGDIQTDTMLASMRAQLQRLSQDMGVSTPIAQARGTSLDILNNNISPGTSDIAPVIQSFASSVTGVSPEYFFGGGNAAYSQAAFQIAVTNENIHARYQIGEIEPLMRFIVNTLIQNDARIMSLKIVPDDFDVEFESIYDETEQEKIDLLAKKTEVLIRQRDYPELEKAFKQLDLLSDEVSLVFDAPHTGDGNELDTDSKDSKLVKPLL